jgi:DNA helicase-2/ATP-dependent DNA helicase PcrA
VPSAFDPRSQPDRVSEPSHAGEPDDAGPAWLAGASDAGVPSPARRMSRGAPHTRTSPASSAPAVPAPTETTEDLLKDLTAPQRDAVLHTEGPVLVLAAAGSGKTRVITRRIAHLVACGVPGFQILALTFTNKAAGEMRERVEHLLGGPGSRAMRGLTVTTFHSLCARLLRRYATFAGIKEDFTIYDSGDQAALAKKVVESLQLSTSNFPPRSVLSAISNAKNQLLGPQEYAARAGDFSSRTIAKVYAGYEKALRAANAVDFDDLLLLTATMLRDKREVLEELRGRYQYLLVDEYQDTNRAQFVIASAIAGGGARQGANAAVSNATSSAASPNICVVGDPDQAIYGWRGADISNILDFESAYPGCKVITLGENFRSTAPILATADALIRQNKRRKHKDLFTTRAGGDKPEAVLCRDERHESVLVADWLKARREDDVAWKDMAIFYRTNALSRVLEDALRGAGVPYTIARGTAFFDREEVKNALGYLRVVANPADDVSLERIVNTPSRGISDATLDKLRLEGARAGEGLLATMRRVDASWASAGLLNARAVASVQKFALLIDELTGHGAFFGARVAAGVAGSLADLVDRVVKESGLEDMYKRQAAQSQSDADSQRLDNLAELVSSARQFELEYDPASDPAAAAMDLDPFAEPAKERHAEAASVPADGTPPPDASIPPATPMTGPRLLGLLRAFLESVALVADADSVDPTQGSVTLMTLHAAKGLEFRAVAMVGLEEGLLPHSRAITAPTSDEMEEERRLCFVGITRAMRRLLVTSAKYRTIRGTPNRTIPSRFLGEVPGDLLSISDQSGGQDGAWDAEGEDEFERDEHAGAIDVPRAQGPSQGQPRPSRATGLAAQFPTGCKVRHPQFGVGTVRSVTAGAQARAMVEFRDVGTKTLVLEYARLTRIG